MKKLWCSVLVLLLCVAMGLSAQTWSKDETEIRGLIEKFSLMWTADNGLEIFESISSADNFLHVTPQGGNGKAAFIQFYAVVKADNSIVKHTHQVHKIVITNNVAYEYGTIGMTMKNGATNSVAVMNIFVKEAAGWKLLANLPMAPIKDIVSK
jgi:hypothetical protein